MEDYMKKPIPLGRYPLVLRDSDIIDTKYGELLLEYSTDSLYYIDRHDGKKINIAKMIYDKIILDKLENSKIDIVKSNDDISSDVPVIPDISERKFNTWYMNTYNTIIV